MPRGLRRFHESGQSHFVTFSCYRRKASFKEPAIYNLFPVCLEATRRRFRMRVYGYVVMPEHVHLLVSEPNEGNLSQAIHHLKLSFSKRVPQVRALPLGANLGEKQPFWQKRYYDRNVKDYREFTVKLRYLHRNPVKRGLVRNPMDWPWSSFRHYALREVGVVEIESQWTATDHEQESPGAPARIFLRPG